MPEMKSRAGDRAAQKGKRRRAAAAGGGGGHSAAAGARRRARRRALGGGLGGRQAALLYIDEARASTSRASGPSALLRDDAGAELPLLALLGVLELLGASPRSITGGAGEGERGRRCDAGGR